MTDKNIENYKDLFFDKKTLAHLAIVRKNNIPHVTPVWFDLSKEDFENGIINVNSAKGRVKSNNLSIGSKVSLSIVDTDSIYRYIGINGVVQQILEGQEAIDHINQLSFKYTGNKVYKNLKNDDQRVKYVIRIESIF